VTRVAHIMSALWTGLRLTVHSDPTFQTSGKIQSRVDLRLS